MTLAEDFASELNTGTARIATFDIERLPGTFAAEFWDLNQFKNRRIRPDEVTEWPRTICAAWKWYGTKRPEFAAEWEPDGPAGFAQAVWDVFDSADILIGHNVKRFDVKHMKGLWLLAGRRPPKPPKIVDTLTVARSEFGFESNTLDSLCARLGVPRKVDRYDPRVARAAVEGDTAAQRRIKRYNQGDVIANEALYDRFRGWMPGHPHMGLWTDELACNQCGHVEHLPNGEAQALSLSYAAYTCENCGAPLRRQHHKRRTIMRPAR